MGGMRERRLHHPLPLTDGQVTLWARCPAPNPWVAEHLEHYPPPPEIARLLGVQGGIRELPGWVQESVAANPAIGEMALDEIGMSVPVGSPAHWGAALGDPVARGYLRNPAASPARILPAARFLAGMLLADRADFGDGSPDVPGPHEDQDLPALRLAQDALTNPALGAGALMGELWEHAALRPLLLRNPAADPAARAAAFWDPEPDTGLAAAMPGEEVSAALRRAASLSFPRPQIDALLGAGALPPGDAAWWGGPVPAASIIENRRAPREWVEAAIRLEKPGTEHRALLPLLPQMGEPSAEAIGRCRAAASRSYCLLAHGLDRSGLAASVFRGLMLSGDPPRPAFGALWGWSGDLARNPWLPPDVADASARLPDPATRALIAGHPCLCDLGAMNRLASDRSPLVRRALAAHPLLVFAPAQQRLAASRDEAILAALRANPTVARHGILARGGRLPLPEPFFPDRAGEDHEEEPAAAFPPARAPSAGVPTAAPVAAIAGVSHG